MGRYRWVWADRGKFGKFHSVGFSPTAPCTIRMDTPKTSCAPPPPCLPALPTGRGRPESLETTLPVGEVTEQSPRWAVSDERQERADDGRWSVNLALSQ